jgi:hypothetical protein
VLYVAVGEKNCPKCSAKTERKKYKKEGWKREKKKKGMKIAGKERG